MRDRDKKAAPLGDEEQQQIVANLKSEKLPQILGGLRKLRFHRSPQPNAEITAALKTLLEHQNRLVRQQAEAMLEKWSAKDEPE